MMVVGGPGSNQCVATTTFALQLRDPDLQIQSNYVVPEDVYFFFQKDEKKRKKREEKQKRVKTVNRPRLTTD